MLNGSVDSAMVLKDYFETIANDIPALCFSRWSASTQGDNSRWRHPAELLERAGVASFRIVDSRKTEKSTFGADVGIQHTGNLKENIDEYDELK